MKAFSFSLISALFMMLSCSSFLVVQTQAQDLTLNPGPRSDREARFLYDQGLSKIESDPPEAVRNLKRLMLRYPQFPKWSDAKNLLANALFNLKDFAGAKELFGEIVLTLEPGSERETVRLKLALTNWYLGRDDLALAAISEILKNSKPESGTSIQALLVRSKIRSAQDRLPEAQADYDAATAQGEKETVLSLLEPLQLQAWIDLNILKCKETTEFKDFSLCTRTILARLEFDQDLYKGTCSKFSKIFEGLLQKKQDPEEKSRMKQDWKMLQLEMKCEG